MKKLSLIIILVSAILLLQKCKKDTFNATATSSNTMFAVINDTTWTADTITAGISYSSAAKSKVFTCTAIANNKEVNIMVTQANAINTAGFPLSAFNADVARTNTFSFYRAEKNSSGVNTFYQQGTVGPGSGTISFTAVDSVKKVMSGTFSLVSKKTITIIAETLFLSL